LRVHTTNDNAGEALHQYLVQIIKSQPDIFVIDNNRLKNNRPRRHGID